MLLMLHMLTFPFRVYYIRCIKWFSTKPMDIMEITHTPLLYHQSSPIVHKSVHKCSVILQIKGSLYWIKVVTFLVHIRTGLLRIDICCLILLLYCQMMLLRQLSVHKWKRWEHIHFGSCSLWTCLVNYSVTMWIHNRIKCHILPSSFYLNKWFFF